MFFFFFQSIAKDFIILLDMSVCYTIFIYYRTVYQFLWAELGLINNNIIYNKSEYIGS
jgi:hypothetical protein